MDQRLLDALRKFARNEIDLFATPFGLFEDEDLAASPTGPLILNPADPQTFQRLAVYLALHRLDVPVVSYDDAFMDDAAGYMAIDGAALSVGDEPIYDVDTAYAAALDAVEAKGRLVRGRRTLRPRLLLVRAIREEIADAEEIERFGRDAQRLLTSAPDTIGASSIELGRVAALLEAMQDAAADAGDSVAENGAGELPGLTQAVTPEIDLVFAFGGPWRETEQTRAAVDVLTADLKAAVPAAEVTIRIWGASELISAFERVSLAAVGVLKGAHLLSLPEIGPRFDGTKRAAAGWIGYAPATAVVGLIQGPDGMPDARLFYDNVRHYLGEDTLKNPGAAGLSRTLELGDGPEVVLRHNGITIVARAAEIDEQSGDVMLREYQIVNGAQTAFTLFTHRKRLGEAGQALAHVPIKIVVTEDESIKDGVVLGANTQSAVDRYDMLARRPEMRALQLAFEADAHWSPQKLWLQRRRAEPFRTRVAPIRVLTPRQLME
ncbi:MAG: AIPR family protein, partial [Pseudomonadota bacterium]